MRAAPGGVVGWPRKLRRLDMQPLYQLGAPMRNRATESQQLVAETHHGTAIRSCGMGTLVMHLGPTAMTEMDRGATLTTDIVAVVE